MGKQIHEMTYREFNEYCNERACDGQWDIMTAVACVSMIKDVNNAVRGKLFKRRAREKVWQELLSTLKEGQQCVD